jgi:hypothetical protein
MSEGRSGKSHAFAWTLLVLAVPLLYGLTLPLIKVAVVEPTWPRGSSSTFTRPYPDWLFEYSKPYGWLAEHYISGLWNYENWWFKLLSKDP